ncbi:MAG: dioxygenase [Bdellovibrionales bacterium]|nr:dioxygenase [Oligoflexia bacterium]
MSKQPVFFVSHGGGPWPFIPEMRAELARTVAWMNAFASTLIEKPKCILCIDAHWEEDEFTISSAAHPPMIYDYSGFPAHTYQIQYPAPGSPEIANRVTALLKNASIPIHQNPTRGFDHGAFIPLGLMFSKADIPVVSLSIKRNYDPLDHIRMGEALAPLRNEGVLIIGSGLSYHNMRGFGSNAAGESSKLFGDWLEVVINSNTLEARIEKLSEWERAPAARSSHPDEDHLIPLMAVVGAAQNDPGKVSIRDHAMGVDMASYQFG